MLLFSLLLFAVSSHNVLSAASGYKGFKIYDVISENLPHSDLLYELSEQDSDYDFFILTRIPHKPARVMVPPEKQKTFVEFLNQNDMKFYVVNANVGETIEKQTRSTNRMSSSNDDLGTDRYHSHEAINKYIEDLAVKYPDRIFAKTVGYSYEHRPLKTITITNGDGRPNKNVIFIDGGFHAREWISPATVVYIISQLANNPTKYAHLVKDYDWIILPVVNADGYEFTRSSSANRFWRKTRRPSGSSVGRECIGTDPNRNFDFHWNEKGTSSNPCSDIFAGRIPFSEDETKIVRDLLLWLGDRGIFYVTLHSYGPLILYPWGWTYDLPEGWEALDEVSKIGQEAIRNATGTNYVVGSSANAIYIAAGASDDYAYAIAKFAIAVTMELPAGGSNGFDPPESDIESSCKESWIGIKAMAERVIQKYK